MTSLKTSTISTGKHFNDPSLCVCYSLSGVIVMPWWFLDMATWCCTLGIYQTRKDNFRFLNEQCFKKKMSQNGITLLEHVKEIQNIYYLKGSTASFDISCGLVILSVPYMSKNLKIKILHRRWRNAFQEWQYKTHCKLVHDLHEKKKEWGETFYV